MKKKYVYINEGFFVGYIHDRNTSFDNLEFADLVPLTDQMVSNMIGKKVKVTFEFEVAQ